MRCDWMLRCVAVSLARMYRPNRTHLHPIHPFLPAAEEPSDEEAEDDQVMDTDGGKRTRGAGEGSAERGGATAGRAAAARKEGRDNLQFEDPFEGEAIACGGSCFVSRSFG